jgi:N-acetylmuramoyl-L-alanine amidase
MKNSGKWAFLQEWSRRKKAMTSPAYNPIKSFFLIIFLFPAVLLAAQSTIPPITDAVADTKCVVVIDAGHGGGEWGVSVRGVQEKNINLELAKKIKQKIEKAEKNITVLLTRTGDDFLKTEDRAGFANSNKACIYISIHCDYAPSTRVEGYKVYYMQGAETNRADGQGLVKWGEVQQRHVEGSKKLVSYLTQYLRAALIAEAGGGDENDLVPIPSRGEAAVKSDVLINLDMPAVVLEAGNLNNGDDFMNLKDSRILNQMAYHIKEGIVNYLKEVKFNQGGTQQ